MGCCFAKSIVPYELINDTADTRILCVNDIEYKFQISYTEAVLSTRQPYKSLTSQKIYTIDDTALLFKDLKQFPRAIINSYNTKQNSILSHWTNYHYKLYK